jgi:hypothetical protein
VDILKQYCRTILAHLLNEQISDQQCSQAALLTEKLFSCFYYEEIKAQLNEVLKTKPIACDWHPVFARLAHINLHLCVTLITMAAPHFNPDEVVMYGKTPQYPFTELYALLCQKLQFDDTPAPKTPVHFLPDDTIKLNNVRAQAFFRHIQVMEEGRSTALHFAVLKGYMDIVPALIKNNPHLINLPDKNGQTPLTLVSRHSQIDKNSASMQLYPTLS